MNKTEEYIENIKRKLINQKPLTEPEIRSVISALSESNNILQEPYYEVVFHDEYDRQERRIMNPVGRTYSHAIPGSGEYIIEQNRFEVNFNRLIPANER